VTFPIDARVVLSGPDQWWTPRQAPKTILSLTPVLLDPNTLRLNVPADLAAGRWTFAAVDRFGKVLAMQPCVIVGKLDWKLTFTDTLLRYGSSTHVPAAFQNRGTLPVQDLLGFKFQYSTLVDTSWSASKEVGPGEMASFKIKVSSLSAEEITAIHPIAINPTTGAAASKYSIFLVGKNRTAQDLMNTWTEFQGTLFELGAPKVQSRALHLFGGAGTAGLFGSPFPCITPCMADPFTKTFWIPSAILRRG
jgi:hypothetical protein